VLIIDREAGTAPELIACCRPSLTPLGDTGGGESTFSRGVDGCEPDCNIALPSSESASNNSGGRRSFSISDLRLSKEGQPPRKIPR
jgi:hypothetical protein